MTLWAADSHVHFHKCFDEGLFFDSCFNHLTNINSSSVKNGLLFFTEGKNEDSYNYLNSKTKIKSSLNENTEYIVKEIDNANTIEVSWNQAGMRILILPGFQIVTKENLEVLSLGTKKRLSDGLLIEDTIFSVLSLGGIPVLPWGFGKWFGNRGKKIEELIKKNISHLFLGDNGGRSSLLPFPNQFKAAKKNGMKILPGSDPLPFFDEVKRPMSYGFIFNTNMNESNPWESIKKTLLDTNLKIENFGSLTAPVSFIKTQIAMQFKKRRNK
jgi:hypothetical protein